MADIYNEFLDVLTTCNDYAKDYLHRCIIDGKVNANDYYYYKNLFALQIDATGNARILVSNTDPNCENETLKSYNIRFINIDKDLFNKTEEEFDKEHIDKSLYNMVQNLNRDEKLQLYDALKDMLGYE